MKKKFVLFILISSLFSCQTVSEKIDSNIEKEDKKLSKWLKKTETELKIDFGKPDKIEFLNNSNRNYVYVTEKLKIKCVRKFEINPRDIVVGYTSKNCF